MYKIIGSDGKTYGPVTAEQLRGWMAQHRVESRTPVLPDGTKTTDGTDSSLSLKGEGPLGRGGCFGVSRLAWQVPAETITSLGTD